MDFFIGIIIVGIICVGTLISTIVAIFDDDAKTICIIAWILLFASIGGLYLYYYYNSNEYLASKAEEAIAKCDFGSAHKYLKKLEEPERTVQLNKLFDAEVKYLMSENSIVNSDRIISLMSLDYGFSTSPVVGITGVRKVIKNNDNYMLEVSAYNQKLDGILAQAISMKNQYLAEKLLNLYKPTLRKSLHNTHTWSSDEYNYEYSNEPKEKAEEVYKKAVKEKKFE